MVKYEEKFIVINTKHIKELSAKHPASCNLDTALIWFKEAYELTTKKQLNQKYYVCNQDELYAQEVIDIIINGETMIGSSQPDVEADACMSAGCPNNETGIGNDELCNCKPSRTG